MFGLVSKKLFAPYSLAKGSFHERLARAKEYNCSFFENIKDSFEYREVKPKTYLKKLKEILPLKISVKVMDTRENQIQKLPTLYITRNIKDKFNGYIIYLPYNYFSKNIPLNTTGTFMHETQHLFDFIFNPKFIKRRVNLINKTQNPSEYLDYYKNNIYSSKKFSKKELKNFLKNKPVEEQINFLQFCRYQLYTEQNAFKHSNPYQRKIEKIYAKEINYKETLTKYGIFQFNAKIKYIENMLAGKIKSVRESIAT